MRLNTAVQTPRPLTHHGMPGPRLNPYQQLQRSLLGCMLWEDEFYEDGVRISDRIVELAAKVDPAKLAELAIEARTKQHLRHVPLLLLSVLADTGKGTSVLSWTIPKVVRRPDELGELLAVYAKVKGVGTDELKPVLTKQLKKGLAKAFERFDSYQLAKYDRKGAITLRDVMFLCHPRPRTEEQREAWPKLIDGTLAPPDTWEVGLSKGRAKKSSEEKREVFERLLRTGRMGYMALLRNLAGMSKAGVDRELIGRAIVARKGAKHVLPFRYLAAARAAMDFEPFLDEAMIAGMQEMEAWPGTTVVMVDVSASMNWAKVSTKSQMTRMDAACALGAMVRAEHKIVFSFSRGLVQVAPREGMAMVDAIQGSQHHSGTAMGAALALVQQYTPHDRLVVITDEQSQDEVPEPTCRWPWMLNVASNENGVGISGRWNRITGWSEQVLRYIGAVEEMAK